LRDAVLAHIGTVMPFYERHLVAVDSPHEDPLQKGPKGWAGATPTPSRTGRKPLPLSPVYPVREGLWGVQGVDMRSGVKQLYLVGREVLPGLGFEGDFLTAWSAARVVLESSGRKDLLRRQVLLGGD
jgi:hypothetical protein